MQYDIPLLYNDRLNSFLTLAAAIFAIDGVQKKFRKIRIGRLRRQFVCVSFILQVIFIYMIYLLGFGRMNVTIFKSFDMAFASLIYVRFTANNHVILPQFAGILDGVCNSLASIMVVSRLFAIEYIISCNLGHDETYLKHAEYICKII